MPPWEELHELSRDELRLTNLVTTDAVAEVLLPDTRAMPVAEVAAKPVQDRFATGTVGSEKPPVPAAPSRSTKTAEATATGGVAPAVPAQ